MQNSCIALDINVIIFFMDIRTFIFVQKRYKLKMNYVAMNICIHGTYVAV